MNETAVHVSFVPVRTWLAVTVLGISAFSIVTSELAPVGMLSTLAKDLNQTESGAGLVVTAYGWVGAFAALLSGAISARISRKTLLVGLMLILALSCMAATFSSSMSTFMSARMAGALAHGAFWAMIGIVGAQLVPAQKAWGLPPQSFLAASRQPAFWVYLFRVFIASMAGWRNAFMLISLLALAAACALFWTLPALAAPQPLRLRLYCGLFKNPVLMSLYLCNSLHYFGPFRGLHLSGTPVDEGPWRTGCFRLGFAAGVRAFWPGRECHCR